MKTWSIESFHEVEIIVDQQIIVKCNEELLFGQLCILQSKTKTFLKEDVYILFQKYIVITQ